ncbi:hypothetical protein [Paenibacillus sp.]|uniref:hypothetical protein n=1 Tax=Paenibacillus sp. TaxID=58172 RepID=UPI002D5B742F|nr:hypothetical protein [Paenibacillus sp.]HZG58187.1 hypothetical protein [Paenibacillus sp.]
MKRTLGKEFGYQLAAAAFATATFPLLLVAANDVPTDFWAAYSFYFIFSALAYMTVGVLFAVAIERAADRWSPGGGPWRYVASLIAYAAAGVLAMYVYLATLLRNLEIQPNASLFAVGALAALYMYHVAMGMKRLRAPKTTAQT